MRGLNRTLKEQVIHGRVYWILDELRNAVRRFVDRYIGPVTFIMTLHEEK